MALAAAAALAGCATQRAEAPATAPSTQTVVASAPQPARLEPQPVDPRWDRPLTDALAAELFAAACLELAPMFPSAAAFDAAGFRTPGGAPGQGAPVFAATRADGAAARLARRIPGDGAPQRYCELSAPGLDAAAVRRALDPKLRAAFAGARVRRSRGGWRVTDKETELALRVAVRPEGGAVRLSAVATE